MDLNRRNMKRFFTSDWHLCSESVFTLAKRPFRDIDKMNDIITRYANQRAFSRSDVIYHLGDFYNKCTNSKYKCYRKKYTSFLDSIKAQMVMIEGNHDIQNNVKCIGKLLWMNLSGYNISLGHYPSTIREYDERYGENLTPKCYDNIGRNHIHICGHVHRKWKYFIDEENMILNINVGVDEWKYNIVSERELINYIESILNKDVIIGAKRLFLKSRGE